MMDPRLTRWLAALARRWLGVRQLDHLVRFNPILGIVLASGAPGATILDVGSGSMGITSLLPAPWQATAVDASFDDYVPQARPRPLTAHQQLGDVRALPFEDRSFDVAVAVDLLEHVPASDRPQAVSEICRVSRRRAIIACPAGHAALDADRQLADWFAGRGQVVPGWLAEHLENGFPEADDVATVAAAFGTVTMTGNENVGAHVRLISAENRVIPALALRLACRPLEWLMTSHRPGARRLAAGLLDRAGGHDREPNYRVVVVVDRVPSG